MANDKKLGFKSPLENGALFQTPAAEEPQQKKMGRPRKDGVQRDSGASEGLQKGSTRYTVIFEERTLNDLKQYAKINHITIKAALTQIIDKFMDDYRKNPEQIRAEAERLVNEFMNGANDE